MNRTGMRAGVACLAAGALAACLFATEDCMLLVSDADYRVAAPAALTACTLTTANTLGCPAGQLCVGELCQYLCASDSDCQTNWRCIMAPVPDAGPATKVCAPHCNPLAPQQPDSTHVACPGSEGCFPVVNVSPPFTDCIVAGSTSPGGSCTATSECLPGYVCFATSTGAACRKYCRMGQNDCGAGATCNAFAIKVTDEQYEIGACL